MLSAGFLLVRRVIRPAYVSAALIPSTIVSASDCISPQFPGPYAIGWASIPADDREAAFSEVGVSPELRESAIEWATSALRSVFGWPGVFFTLDAALEARSRFLSSSEEVRLIGLGLDERFADSFIDEATTPYADTGYLVAVRERRSIPPGGTALGYEPLDLEDGHLQHSWLCNGLEQHCADVLGIRPGAYGLLQSFDDALRCCDEINREEVGAEPGYWLPIFLTDYS